MAINSFKKNAIFFFLYADKREARSENWMMGEIRDILMLL